MREIKFRCWTGFKMRYAGEDEGMEGLRITHDAMWYFELGDSGFYWHEMTDKDYVFQQFTGKIDKNGKEIYEGDLVNVVYPKGNEFMGKDQNYVDEVYWDDDTCGFMIKREVGADSMETGAKTIKVVGNIYETPKKTNGKS